MTDCIQRVWPDWTVEREIGFGAFAAVYSVCRKETGQRSAVKIIHIPDETAKRTWTAENIAAENLKAHVRTTLNDRISEIHIMTSLRGLTNIVSIEDYAAVEQDEGLDYTLLIRMELLTPLRLWCGQFADSRVSERDIIRLGVDICTALELCGRKNILHRDIKPENIFINDFGCFKLGDFGISRNIEGISSGLSQRGTPQYAAPEVFSLSNYDNRADLYSLGLVLYWLANRNALPFCLPVQLENPLNVEKAIVRRLAGEELPPLPDVSPSLSSVILKACAFNPADRYSTAAEMREALQRAASSSGRSRHLSASAKKLLCSGHLRRYPANPTNGTKPPDPETVRFPEVTAAAFSSGNGTKASPYEIASVADLLLLSELVANHTHDGEKHPYSEKYYCLSRNIDLPDGKADRPFTPIGPSPEAPFRGHFDGKGHAISGFLGSAPFPYAGLFGVIEEAEIADLSAEAFSYSCFSEEVKACGGIAGLSRKSRIRNCHFDGAIHAYSCVGGIVGKTEDACSLSECTAKGTVKGFSQSGGICGHAFDSVFDFCVNHAVVTVTDLCSGGVIGDCDRNEIRNCVNYGNVFGPHYVGGLSGFIMETTIEHAANNGMITANVLFAGGIAGRCALSTVSDSANNCLIFSEGDYSGGIAGLVENHSSLVRCTNTGQINAKGVNNGGIAGQLKDSTVEESANTGEVTSKCILAGGITGFAISSVLVRCKNTGTVSSNSVTVDGIAGCAESSTFISCLNEADPSAGSPVSSAASDM